MANAIWHISQLEREASDGFVFVAHYAVNLQSGKYSAGSYGSIGFKRPKNLIPYSNLSEELVVSWVKEALGDDAVTTMEEQLQTQIDQQVHPTTKTGVPW